MGIWGQLLLQLILILLNAIFACAEIAVISVSDAKLAKLEEQGDKRAKKLKKLKDKPEKFLSTIQVAITLSGFLGSAFAADNFSGLIVDAVLSAGIKLNAAMVETISVVLITLVLSYCTLILGELVPKRLAMRKSEKLALAMSGMLCGVAKLFTPIVWLLSVSTNGILRLLGIDPNETEDDVSEEEIRLMVDEGSQKGIIDEQEQELIENVFEFDDLTVSDFATHRTDITPLWMEDGIEEWEKIIHETRHLMYPVCGETIDEVVGVLNIKDFFRLRSADKETIVKEAVKQAYFVPEGIHADVLFKQMKDTKQHFAVVLDEYGGLMGIVTMNDILQQLVGDIADMEAAEHEEPDMEKIDENTWVIRGISPLEEVAEELGIEMPTDKYDTMGGYVFSNYGIVPEDGTEFELELEPLHIKVTEIKDHRIERMTVVLTLPESEEEDDDDDEDERDRDRKKDKKSDDKD
ncbi:MAG: HlyC/CorC family transporter [Ruminococcaceae bacterium]|nr:HlyC/CorC family transporter [Oscillospiraceae bacterium]